MIREQTRIFKSNFDHVNFAEAAGIEKHTYWTTSSAICWTICYNNIIFCCHLNTRVIASFRLHATIISYKITKSNGFVLNKSSHLLVC